MQNHNTNKTKSYILWVLIIYKYTLYTKMVAGSILPVAVHKNKLYFLFGKENPMEDSAKGWSDFGGRCDSGETPNQAAMREGSEELTGFLGDKTSIQGLISESYKLTYNDYHIHMFLMEHDENLPKYYNNNHRFLWDHMDRKTLNDSKLFEKIEIDWFSESELVTRRKEFRGFYQNIVEKICENLSEIRKFMKKPDNPKRRSSKHNNRKTKKMRGGR